jgi:taspase (threonine aspartase 1)
LQRVPPNFLVGQGATDFAYDHGLPIVPDDFLVSATAKSRWVRWQHELEAAQDPYSPDKNTQGDETSTSSANPTATINPAMLMTPPTSLHDSNNPKDQDDPSDHGNLAQQETTPSTGDGVDKCFQDGGQDITPSFAHNDTLSFTKETDEMHLQTEDGNMGSIVPSGGEEPGDKITDTIGAIAIDNYGKIAAGSSSGGIGMKHRGRIGPAALVGIGTAVIPVDALDPEQTSVAVVTSGTGEHIATTLAASTCANRIYFSDRKDENGMTENVTEEEAIKSMIDKDFLGEFVRKPMVYPLAKHFAILSRAPGCEK